MHTLAEIDAGMSLSFECATFGVSPEILVTSFGLIVTGPFCGVIATGVGGGAGGVIGCVTDCGGAGCVIAGCWVAGGCVLVLWTPVGSFAGCLSVVRSRSRSVWPLGCRGSLVLSDWCDELGLSTHRGAYNAFTQNAVGGVGSAGGSLQIFSETAGLPANSRNDNIGLQIDLTGQTLVPGTYSGTLNLQAVVQ